MPIPEILHQTAASTSIPPKWQRYQQILRELRRGRTVAGGIADNSDLSFFEDIERIVVGRLDPLLVGVDRAESEREFLRAWRALRRAQHQ